jgi:hypothetical protein
MRVDRPVPVPVTGRKGRRMSDRLPMPVLLVAFEASATLPDCLRAALEHSRRLHLGISFDFGPDDDLTQFIVQPWMTLPDVLAMWDGDQAASVAEHEGVHGG